MKSERKLNKKDAKMLLLEHFEGNELVIFYMVMRLVLRTNVKKNVKNPISRCEIKNHLYGQTKTRTLFLFTAKMLGLKNPHTKQDLQYVYHATFDNVLRLKEAILSYYHEHIELHITKYARASNPQTGEVVITIHALERFYEYTLFSLLLTGGIVNKITYEFLVRQFQIAFSEAEKIEIKPEIKVKRIINNNFKKAKYFVSTINEKLQLRFVVLEKKPVILTVEIPIK